MALGGRAPGALGELAGRLQPENSKAWTGAGARAPLADPPVQEGVGACKGVEKGSSGCREEARPVCSRGSACACALGDGQEGPMLVREGRGVCIVFNHVDVLGHLGFEGVRSPNKRRFWVSSGLYVGVEAALGREDPRTQGGSSI